MAYAQSGLNPGGANAKGGPHISSYATADSIATVEGANYFDNAADLLNNENGHGVIFVFNLGANATVLYGYQSTATAVTLDVANKKVLD